MKRVCFYHAGCPDGFGAAWAVWRAWGDDARYVARGHEDVARTSDCQGCEITFVDIAPKNDELRALGEVAERLTLLDHHVTSQRRFASEPALAETLARRGHEIVFDLEHSGAVLAWQHFAPDAPVPDLLRYVEDQDLWSWKLPHSEEVNAAIDSHPRRFAVWSGLAGRSADDLAREGEPIVRAKRSAVEHSVQNATTIVLKGRRLEAVNATSYRSAVGHALAERARYGAPWGCVYRVIGGEVQGTLYSIGDLDVAEVAVAYGGGGHKNAAGFAMPLQEWLDDCLE